ncbi:hypothetical protein Acsp06_55110 [Actinomycetospora sp. NBRC 106375]|nr:hypothetical protein Acsp06_55110 [Actinomycetospora sp. NBRC 106375]
MRRCPPARVTIWAEAQPSAQHMKHLRRRPTGLAIDDGDDADHDNRPRAAEGPGRGRHNTVADSRPTWAPARRRPKQTPTVGAVSRIDLSERITKDLGVADWSPTAGQDCANLGQLRFFQDAYPTDVRVEPSAAPTGCKSTQRKRSSMRLDGKVTLITGVSPLEATKPTRHTISEWRGRHSIDD